MTLEEAENVKDRYFDDAITELNRDEYALFLALSATINMVKERDAKLSYWIKEYDRLVEKIEILNDMITALQDW